MSKYFDAMYSRYERVRSRLVQIYDFAARHYQTHEELLERKGEIYKTNDYKKLSSYYVGAFNELSRTKLQELWSYHLQSGYLVRGKFYPARECNEVLYECGKHNGIVVWKNCPEKIFSKSADFVEEVPSTSEQLEVNS
jgi:hypothetical protein